eukprot:scaffold1299_cov246-Pinguiococcus_pyrenoidosus.AAC.5
MRSLSKKASSSWIRESSLCADRCQNLCDPKHEGLVCRALAKKGSRDGYLSSPCRTETDMGQNFFIRNWNMSTQLRCDAGAGSRY